MAAAGLLSPGNPIRDHLASLLTDYQRIRQEDPFTSHPLQAAMRDLKKRVETSEVVAQHPDLLVKASVGQGDGPRHQPSRCGLAEPRRRLGEGSA